MIKIKEKLEKHFILNGVEVKIFDPLPKSINFKTTLKKVFKMVPSHLLTNISLIKIGQFPELNRRKLQAMYTNKTIFLTNEHEDEDSIIDDVIHELAHSVEVKFAKKIYGDGLLKAEFLRKRKELWQKLKNKGLSIEVNDFLNHKFSEKLDNLFYYQIGYPALGVYTSSIFYSPYACTSLREYFANGFEAFFMKEEVSKLKKVSPILYKKIVNLTLQ